MEISRQEIEREYNEMMRRIEKTFYNILGYKNAKKYINGLLGPAKRKNGWQMAESQGDETPYKIQQFIGKGRYDADEMRDALRGYVSDKLGDDDGILIVDETGFLKQGKKSCGVQRQYSGTAGRIENCQIGVFLTYASPKGYCPVDRRLYIPESWMNDKERCEEAGIPETTVFQTKPQMALEMIQEATAAGVPYKWITGDCVYGDYRDIRTWLEESGKYYVMNVSGKERVWQGFEQNKVGDILKGLPNEGWIEASCGDGSKGARVYDWMTVEINSPVKRDFQRTMLVRRSKTAPDEKQAYICCAPANEPISRLIKVAGTRWTVETCFMESKSEVGLDQYEYRSYNGWYRHITFACIALALLTVLSCSSMDKLCIQQHNPSAGSLKAFKKGRNLRA